MWKNSGCLACSKSGVENLQESATLVVELDNKVLITWLVNTVKRNLAEIDSLVCDCRFQLADRMESSLAVHLAHDDIWGSIHRGSAVNCATALLQGETGLKLDINAVDPDVGFTLLHRFSDDPDITELLLGYGACPDIRCKGCLPLDSAIGEICDMCEIDRRLPIHLIIVLMGGLHDLARHLECVRLLFRATKEVEKEIYRYVKDGKLIEVAALLIVAREEVTSPSLFKGLCYHDLNGRMSLRQLVLSEIVSLMTSQITLVSTSEEVHDELNNKLETMMSMLRMIEVFERVGDKIELYRQYLTKCFKEFWAAQMACMLISEGLAEYKDFELKSDDESDISMVASEFEFYLSEIFGCNLYEGMQLESGTTKIYKQHDVDPVWIPRLSNSNRPPMLEIIQILNNEDDTNSSFPLKKEFLESIKLVACKTDEIEAIGCSLARQGKLIELASLLMVVPEKLIVTTSPGSKDLRSKAIPRCIMSDLRWVLSLRVAITKVIKCV
ncbi:hypothetical protein V6N11_031194 [Hibiscus sabdariffa]|uniref:Uncharacterized protein n=1 Tax=Hibiscus sabdariffa TaxID=183260 RepID=A0ABR2AGQ1_9ROSI